MAATVSKSPPSTRESDANNSRAFLGGMFAGQFLVSLSAGIRDVICAKAAGWAASLLLGVLFGPTNFHVTALVQLYLLYRLGYLWSTMRALHSLASTGRDKHNLFEAALEGLGLCGYCITAVFLHNRRATVDLIWCLSPGVGLMGLLCSFGGMFLDLSIANLTALLGRFLFRTYSTSLPLLNFCLRMSVETYGMIKAGYLNACRLKVRILGENLPEHWGRPYVYQHINAETDVRLLQISQKNIFGEYRCKIVQATLKQAPAYEAISYTWTTASSDRKLFVDGWVILVTQGLKDVVEARASFFGITYLWIDSICINQADLAEKATQIEQMRDIYNRAKIVVAWLGLAPDADECVKFIIHFNLLTEVKVKGNAFMGVDLTQSGRKALLNFMRHPYWSRAWIIQELVVSQNVSISYGNNYFAWSHLQQIAHAMVTDPHKFCEYFDVKSDVNAMKGINQAAMIGFLRHVFHVQKSAKSLDHILNITLDCKATDARDRVYSVLGLSTSASEPTIRPDYTKSNEQLCIDVARHLSQHHPWSLFARSGLGYPSRNMALPSWVPDYIIPPSMGYLTIVDETSTELNSEQQYHAAGIAIASFQLHPRFSILTVPCLIFDSILRLGPICNLEKDPSEDNSPIAGSVESLLRADEWATSNVSSHTYTFTGENVNEAIWRTLVGNRSRHGRWRSRPAPREFGEAYQNFVECRDRILKAAESADIQSGAKYLALLQDAFDVFWDAFAGVGRGRRIAMTEKGALAWVPQESLRGDFIALMQGGHSCIALRKEAMPRPSNGEEKDFRSRADWRYVGECYVHGFMDGEALTLGSWQEMRFW